jgi:uncharacterized membrane protein YebE (DUF533 family)
MIFQQIGHKLKGQNMSAKTETVIETGKAIPAVVGATIYGLTLNEIVAVVTILYVLIQAGFLIYKWYWDWQDKKSQKAKT